MMIKKIVSAVMLVAVALGITSCSVDKQNDISGYTSAVSTQPQTRIHNSFKDVLPVFGFDSSIAENYREGVDYSFSAKCSERDFEKYVDALKKAGFDVKPAEGKGYYAAHTADKYYVEASLVNGAITVYVKR